MSKSQTTFVVATLWECIEPLDRGDRYEDPLDEALREENLGGTCGGGSQLSDECGIEFVDIEIELHDLQRGLAVTKQILEQQGAPKGSRLRYTANGEDQTIEFGVSECLAVFLDGAGLPDSVYESSDINVLAEQIQEVLEVQSLGEIRGSWSGPSETAIFIYGPSAQSLYEALRPILTAYPLAQNARVVIRHGKAELNPETIRLPRHQ
jgi:hypothetical protein